MQVNKNIKIFFNYFLGPVLFAWLSYSIYKQVVSQPHLGQSWQQVVASFNSPLLFNLFLVLLLMLVNWSIEAMKWKLAVEKIQPVSYSRAMKAIFTGVSFSVTTPNRVGEYLGRILYMEEGKRLKAISLTIVCSISQLVITVTMGWLGLLLIGNDLVTSGQLTTIWLRLLLSGIGLALGILTVFYLRISWLVKWIDKMPWSARFAWLINTLEEFNATILWKLLSLSLIRFLVFTIQYYLLFRLFGVDVSWWQGFWGVSVGFLVLAMIPSIALADLGLRGQVTLKLLGIYSVNALGIGFSTASIWFINLVIPSVIGSLLIISIRIFKNKK